MGIGLNGLNSGLADTYSTLLGGASSSSSSGLDSSSLLTDYAAIKNGSYGKMMKSYYAKVKTEDGDDSKSSSSTTKVKDSASASASRSLYQSASTLTSLNYDDRSEENIQKITDSVSAFVKDYNSLMKSAAKSDNATVQKQAEALFDSYYNNYQLFAKIGITMDADRGLSFDEDTFKSAFTDDKGTAGTIKTLFSGMGSFADKAVDRASKIYSAAGDGESITSSKAKYAGSTGGISSSSSSSKTDSSSSKGTSTTAKDSASSASASALYKSVENLSNMTLDNDNKDAAYKAFSSFIKDYNTLVENTADSPNSNVIKQADYLKSLVSSNKSTLSRLGITVNSDKTLSIDETKFKEADMSSARSLFTGSYSFGEKMTDRINQIYRYATQGDTLSGTYTSQGAYNVSGVGSTLDTTL